MNSESQLDKRLSVKIQVLMKIGFLLQLKDDSTMIELRNNSSVGKTRTFPLLVIKNESFT